MTKSPIENSATDHAANSAAQSAARAQDGPSSESTLPGPGDPRYSYAIVTSTMRNLMDGVSEDQVTGPTPCPDFTVKELLEHIVMVQRRVAAIGAGEHWSDVETEPATSGWPEQFGHASHAVMTAWTDSAKLDDTYEVPWGELPGGPMMWVYVAELAIHVWDLATATQQEVDIAEDVLRPAYEVLKVGVPAEGRADPEMPFSEVVDPGPGAAMLVQLAGWAGRKVAAG